MKCVVYTMIINMSAVYKTRLVWDNQNMCLMINITNVTVGRLAINFNYFTVRTTYYIWGQPIFLLAWVDKLIFSLILGHWQTSLSQGSITNLLWSFSSFQIPQYLIFSYTNCPGEALSTITGCSSWLATPSTPGTHASLLKYLQVHFFHIRVLTNLL